MPYRVYPMDTFFYNSIIRYPFEVRCEMASELGFDATYLTCSSEQSWKDLAKLRDVKAKYGLDVAAVYGVADVATPDPKLLNLFETIEGCPAIELAIKSTPDEAAALKFLDQTLQICDRRNINLFLYPHINFWLERIQDGVQLCEKLNHQRLGTMFCGFHWYAIDGKALGTTLAAAKPHLRQVNLSGSRRDPDGLANKATIEPLDDGEMDNFAIVGELKRLRFTGYVGFQGYSTGGDPYAKLKRSLATFRDIEARLERHPNWSSELQV